MAAADVLAVTIAIITSSCLRWIFGDLFEKAASFEHEVLIFAGTAIVCINAALGLYPGYGMSAPDRFRRRLLGVVLVFALVAGWDYLLQHGLWSRLVTVLSCGFALVLTVFFNDIVRHRLQAHGRWGVPVAVHGIGESAEQLIRLLRRRQELGFIPVACLSDAPEEQGQTIAGVPVVMQAAGTTGRLRGARHVFVYLPHLPPDQWEAVINRLKFPHVFLVPAMNGRRTLWVQTRDLQGTLALSMADNLLDRRKLAIKRVMDVCLAVPLLLSLLPLFAAIALLIRLTSPGPAFFVQQRLGQHGRTYGAYKFRTMVVDAEARLAAYLRDNPAARTEYAVYKKLRHDPRVTPLGRILRRYSLDELPQLLNVIKGEMSLVGPRCYLPQEIADMGGNEQVIHSVKPGITGYWQVSGRNRTTFAERLEMDVYYIRNWSVSFDLYILYETARVVLAARDAY